MQQVANNAQCTNTRYMLHVNYTKHVQITSLIFLFVKIVVGRLASHIFHTFNKKWRQVKPKRRQENKKTWIFFPFNNALFKHMFKKNQSAHSLFGAWSSLLIHIRFTPSEWPKTFKTGFLRSQIPWKLDHELGPSKKALFHGPT